MREIPVTQSGQHRAGVLAVSEGQREPRSLLVGCVALSSALRFGAPDPIDAFDMALFWGTRCPACSSFWTFSLALGTQAH